MSEPRPSVSVTPWLVAGILLVAAAVVVIAFVPLALCPFCGGSGRIFVYDEEVQRGSWGVAPRALKEGESTFFQKWG